MARSPRAVVVLGLAAALSPSSVRASPPPYSVDDVLSAPFVDGLTASPRRDALVWTVHERGARNVAVWSGGVAREVTHVADDDGQELDAAQLTPDDTAVVYARGGAGGKTVAARVVVFRAADGLAIHGQLFVPAGGGRHPALVFVHGGPERQMLATFHYFETYTNFYEINQLLVSRGFEVLSVNYRSGIMYGHDFYEAPKRGWLGASEYRDVLAGARFLDARPEVDPHRLGIYGLSYGGYLTALALARNSDVFKAGADQAGVHDWRAIFDSYVGHVTGTPQQRAVAYAASPIASLRSWHSPVFLSQGDDDRNVPFSQGVELANELEARGVEVRTSVVPDELHEFTAYVNNLARFTETVDFLTAHLAPR